MGCLCVCVFSELPRPKVNLTSSTTNTTSQAGRYQNTEPPYYLCKHCGSPLSLCQLHSRLKMKSGKQKTHWLGLDAFWVGKKAVQLWRDIDHIASALQQIGLAFEKRKQKKKKADQPENDCSLSFSARSGSSNIHDYVLSRRQRDIFHRKRIGWAHSGLSASIRPVKLTYPI